MGDIRNGIKNEETAKKGFFTALAGAAVTVAATVASTAITNAQIQNNEAKIKELSKGFGRFTNSAEINALNQKNSELRAKISNDAK